MPDIIKIRAFLGHLVPISSIASLLFFIVLMDSNSYNLPYPKKKKEKKSILPCFSTILKKNNKGISLEDQPVSAVNRRPK